MKVTLVAVCHHSSAVLPECVASFRREAEAAGLEPEVVLVEQSENDDEAAGVAALGPDRILRRPNRGYAAGLNAGAGAASGELLLLANPDIVLLDGSVGALVDAVDAGADVAGPQLVWDRAGSLILPIPDDPGPWAELRRTIDRRWPGRRSLDELIERSWRIWTADRPCPVPSLRGPLLALRRDTFERLGPLDEGYFLYYEETEWLWRARRSGARLVLAPGARVVHRWGHATGRRDDLAAVEARSRARFFRRNYPAPVRAAVRLLDPGARPPVAGAVEVAAATEVPATDADVWLFSIVDHMEPAMGSLSTAGPPPAISEITGIGRWYAAAASRSGDRWQVQGRWTWQTR